MRDYEEKSYYEIQLDNKQLILVFLSGLTVCILIFALGVMVGKGKKEAEMAAVSKPEVNATKTELDLKPPKEVQPVVDSDSVGEKKSKKDKKVKADEEYTFYDLDKPEKQEEEPVKVKAEKPPVDKPTVDKPTADKPTAEKAAVEKPTVIDKKVEASTSAPQPPVEKPVTEPSTPPSIVGSEHQYTVQVMATGSKPKAEQELDFLKSKGYTAYLDEDVSSSGSVYKVRVGKFASPESAKSLASRLKQELQRETWVAVLD